LEPLNKAGYIEMNGPVGLRKERRSVQKYRKLQPLPMFTTTEPAEPDLEPNLAAKTMYPEIAG
jgi:hypothetical protein